jgi:hypothetical protein
MSIAIAARPRPTRRLAPPAGTGDKKHAFPLPTAAEQEATMTQPLTPAERRDCLAAFGDMTVNEFARLIGWDRGAVRRAFRDETQFVPPEIDNLLRDLTAVITRYHTGMAAFRAARSTTGSDRDAA